MPNTITSAWRAVQAWRHARQRRGDLRARLMGAWGQIHELEKQRDALQRQRDALLMRLARTETTAQGLADIAAQAYLAAQMVLPTERRPAPDQPTGETR